MGWFTDLGYVAGGVSQGLDQGQNLRLKAMQLQMYQQQLDEQKRQLAARAGLFNSMGQNPAQAFVPGGAPGGMPGGAPGGMPGGGGLPAQQPPNVGGPMAPQAQPSMSMGPAATTMGGGLQRQSQPMASPTTSRWDVPSGMSGGGQGGPQDQPSPFQMMMAIAQDIKRRNPNMDALTLSDAVSDVIDMQKGLTPDYRAQMQILLQQMRDQAADIRSQRSADTRITVEREGQAGQDRRESMREGAHLRDIGARGEERQKEIQLTQGFIDKRAKAGQINKVQADVWKTREKFLSDRLKAATSKFNTLVNAGADQDEIDKAQDELQQAEEQYKIFQARIGYGGDDSSQGAGATPSGGGAGTGFRPKQSSTANPLGL